MERSCRSVRRGAVGLAVVLSVGVGLSACGGSGSSSTKAKSTSGSTAAGASASADSDAAKQIDDLTASAEGASKATFKAVYTTNGTGTSSTVTIEQKPPKSVFISGDSAVIYDGKTTYICSTSGQKTCITQSGASNPLAGIATLFSPATAITAMKQAHSAVAAKLAGYNVSFSSETFGGQASSCMTVNAQGQAGKYCVTKSGILAYSGTDASNFQLTSYSSDVPDSDFDIPTSNG
jgi:hypothetical protein